MPGRLLILNSGLELPVGELPNEIQPAIDLAKSFFNFMAGNDAVAFPLLMSASDVFGLN